MGGWFIGNMDICMAQAGGNQRRLDYSNVCTVQYSTVQYSTVQYSTVQYSKVQYNTEPCSVIVISTGVTRSMPADIGGKRWNTRVNVKFRH